MFELFIIMDKEITKSWALTKNKKAKRSFQFYVTQMEQKAPRLKNGQGIYLINKYIDLIKVLDTETKIINRMLYYI